jgi:magnesium transporter
LSVLLFQDTVISFQEPHGGDAFDIIRNRIRQGKGRVRKMKADYLAYALLDAVVDCYFSVLEKVGEKIELLDEEIMYHSERRTVLKIHDLKREMIFVRKQMWPAREMINNLVRSETELIHSGNDVFLRDLQDHIVRVSDLIESYREMLSDIMEVYLSNTSNKMNEVMKALTIISSIFIPVTFVVGVYGMNFEYMPELKSKYGYLSLWIIMLLIMGGMAWYIKRKKWW